MGTKSGELDINQDLEFQRREWFAQRIGWWALAAFVAAATLGIFGKGPLSSAQTAEAGAPLWVEYERFLRVGAPSRIAVHGSPPAPGAGFQVHLPRQYFEAFRIDQVTPPPLAIAIGDDDVHLQFGPATDRAKTFTIILDLEPLRVGRYPAAFRVDGVAPVSFVQFAYF